jgi:outer membrane protein TolC
MRLFHVPGLIVLSLLATSLALAGRLAAQQATTADTLADRFLAIVRQRNPDLVAQRATVGAAEARLRAAGPRDAPVLSAELEDIPDGIDVPNAGQLRVMLEREFLTGPRRSAARQIARVQLQVATTKLAVLEQSLRARIDGDLVAWRGWQAVAARHAAEDSLLVDAEAALRSRFASGEARYVDVLRLRTERLRVQSERTAALREAQQGKRRLEGLAPDQADALKGLDLLLAKTPEGVAELPNPPDVDSLLAAGNARRLGDLQVENARAESRRVAASRRTQFSGGLGLQRFGDAAGGFQVGPSLRASVSVPFAVGRSTRALSQAAELAVSTADARRLADITRLRTTLLIGRDRYEAALARVRVYDEALLTGAREEREAALGAFRAGELSLIELLDFERALARAETDRLRAIIEASSAYAQLLTTAAGLTAGETLSDGEGTNE